LLEPNPTFLRVLIRILQDLQKVPEPDSKPRVPDPVKGSHLGGSGSTTLILGKNLFCISKMLLLKLQ
jgi:hypothetical protein